MWLLESMKPSNRPRRMTLVETNHSTGHQVDADSGVIHNVKILGRKSENGRTYSDRAIADAVKLYEGIDVNIDHPSRSKPGAERGMAEWAGVLEGVTERADGVYGDLKLLKNHTLTPQLMEAAERMPGNFGLSHNAMGDVVGPKGKQVVESLGMVRSVDIVRSPATVAGLFESIEPDEPETKEEPDMALQTIREAIEEQYPTTAKAAFELLEAEGVAALVPGDAEMPEGGGSALDGVKQSLADEAVKVFLDPNIDAKETGKQITELAKVAEQVAAKLEGKPKEEAPAADDKPAEEEKKEDKPALESKSTEAEDRMATLLHRAEMRDVLESRDLKQADLSERQLSLLEAVDGTEEMTALIESWPELADRASLVRSVGPRTTDITEEKAPKDAKDFANRITM